MNDTILLFIILFFVSIAAFSFLLNGLLLKFSKTLGIRNNNDTIIRWSATSKPALGGISFFICFLISIAGYAMFFSENNPLYHDKQLLGIITATGIAFLMGLSDDAYNTKPLFKLITQVICAAILIFSGIYIAIFENEILNYILTIFWVVGLMNSINMLDNMDAITAVVSSFIILTAILLFFIVDFAGADTKSDFSNLYLLMLTGVLASLAGFLFYNWHPSKFFMGDTGSQFLGLFLAVIGILFFWNGEMDTAHRLGFEPKTKRITIAALSFIIPIVDTTTVTINRLMRKQSPFIGGKDHTTHALSYLGCSDGTVALIFACISMVSMVLIIIIDLLIPEWNYFYFLFFILYFFTIFGILFRFSRSRKAQEKINVRQEILPSQKIQL